jgi:hypothetical protein
MYFKGNFKSSEYSSFILMVVAETRREWIDLMNSVPKLLTMEKKFCEYLLMKN